MEQVHPDGFKAKPWERRLRESAPAYQAFTAYREAGAARRLRATARALHKSYSLIRRWAKQHSWRERVWAWDLEQERDLAEVARQERREAMRRQLRDADRLERLAMAKLSGVVHRDPVTGELGLDPQVTPRDAIMIYRLALEIRRGATVSSGTDTGEESAEVDVTALSDPELDEVIKLAKERAREETEAKRDDEAEEGSNGAHRDTENAAEADQ